MVSVFAAMQGYTVCVEVGEQTRASFLAQFPMNSGTFQAVCWATWTQLLEEGAQLSCSQHWPPGVLLLFRKLHNDLAVHQLNLALFGFFLKSIHPK